MIIVVIVDDLVITAETLDKLLGKFCFWKTNLETKGLDVNVRKTKIMVNAHNALSQLWLVNFHVMYTIRVLDPTLSNALC